MGGVSRALWLPWPLGQPMELQQHATVVSSAEGRKQATKFFPGGGIVTSAITQTPPFSTPSPVLKSSEQFLRHAVGDFHSSIISNGARVLRLLQLFASRIPILGKLSSLPSELHHFSQIRCRNNWRLNALSKHNFAVVFPGESMAGIMAANDMLNLLNIYSFLITVKLVLISWLPDTSLSVVKPVRAQFSFAKIECFQGKLEMADSGLDGSFSLKLVTPAVLMAEKEEAKAVLTLFLKQQGLSSAAAARTINKSDLFVEHLVSRLHSLHKSRYQIGRELTTIEIREALTPYLKTLHDEHGDSFVNTVEQFPNPPAKVKSVVSDPSPKLDPDHKRLPGLVIESMRQSAMARISETVPAEKLPQHVIYLIELGLDLEKIRVITRRFPPFAYYSLEGKIKPVVDFLLSLGIPKSDIPTIILKRPQLCGISLSENLIPSMRFLEGLGVDKKKWAKLIYRFPALLTYSRQKINSTVYFLREMGLSEDRIGKVLTRCPNIIAYSVEDKLRPTAEYFTSLGIDASIILQRWPQTFGLSIERNLKPLTEFFLERGFSTEEIATMLHRGGALYTYSMAENLSPKWEFFLSMGYPRSDLVRFPQYFGYSLEGRIKPRYALMTLCGLRLLLNMLLSPSDMDLDILIQKKMKKMSEE